MSWLDVEVFLFSLQNQILEQHEMSSDKSPKDVILNCCKAGEIFLKISRLKFLGVSDRRETRNDKIIIAWKGSLAWKSWHIMIKPASYVISNSCQAGEIFLKISRLRFLGVNDRRKTRNDKIIIAWQGFLVWKSWHIMIKSAFCVISNYRQAGEIFLKISRLRFLGVSDRRETRNDKTTCLWQGFPVWKSWQIMLKPAFYAISNSRQAGEIFSRFLVTDSSG